MARRLSIEQMDIVNYVSMAISVCSLAGSLFILACFFRFTHLRKFSFRLVAILSACDALNQIFDLLQPSASDILDMETGTQPVDKLCYVQAAGDTFFELASVLWTSAIAATLYLTVQHRMRLEDSPVALLCFAVVGFGVPAVVTIAPAIDNAFGPAGGWCWIVEDKSMWRFICFYGPLWACMLFNAAVYMWIWRILAQISKNNAAASGGFYPGGSANAGKGGSGDVNSIKVMMTRLQMYPFILLVVWLFASVNRVYELATRGDQVFALYLLQRTLSSSQGLLNAFAYGFSGGVREALREQCGPHCPCLGPLCSVCRCLCPRDSSPSVSVLTKHAASSGLIASGSSGVTGLGKRVGSLSDMMISDGGTPDGHRGGASSPAVSLRAYETRGDGDRDGPFFGTDGDGALSSSFASPAGIVGSINSRTNPLYGSDLGSGSVPTTNTSLNTATVNIFGSSLPLPGIGAGGREVPAGGLAVGSYMSVTSGATYGVSPARPGGGLPASAAAGGKGPRGGLVVGGYDDDDDDADIVIPQSFSTAGPLASSLRVNQGQVLLSSSTGPGATGSTRLSAGATGSFLGVAGASGSASRRGVLSSGLQSSSSSGSDAIIGSAGGRGGGMMVGGRASNMAAAQAAVLGPGATMGVGGHLHRDASNSSFTSQSSSFASPSLGAAMGLAFPMGSFGDGAHDIGSLMMAAGMHPSQHVVPGEGGPVMQVGSAGGPVGSLGGPGSFSLGLAALDAHAAAGPGAGSHTGGPSTPASASASSSAGTSAGAQQVAVIVGFPLDGELSPGSGALAVLPPQVSRAQRAHQMGALGGGSS